MFPARRIIMSGGDVFRDEYSIAFDGGNDYIVADGTNIDFGTNDFTLSLWFNPKGDNTDTYFMSQHASSDNRWYFRLNSSGQVHFYSAIGGSGAIALNSTAVVNTNRWTHIVLSVDRDSATGANIYINGTLDTTSNQSAHASVDYNVSTVSPDTAGQEDLNIGRWATVYAAAKAMSEIAIYHQALSSSEVKAIYNNREPYNHKEGVAKGNLKAWYRMGDGIFDQKFTEDVEGGIVCDMANVSLGSDLLGGKGDFSDASYWSISSGQSIVEGGVGKWLGNDSYGHIKRDDIFTIGKMYRVKFDQLAHNGTGTDCLTLNWSSPYTRVGSAGAVGTMTTFLKAYHADFVLYQASDYGVVASVDNLTVQEVTGGNHGEMTNMASTVFTGDTP